jgi:RNA 2',3'-cyclic 3'-phosphodiesterase
MERLFVAIPLPAAARERLADIATDLPGARWTPAGQLHLTLHFLGDTPAVAVSPLIDALAAIDSPPLVLSFEGLTTFPSIRTPRVLVARLAPTPGVISLADTVRRAAADLDLRTEDRPFRPHVTLARLREPDREALLEFARHTPLALRFTAEEFVLFASRLTSTGALHQRRATFRLAP